MRLIDADALLEVMPKDDYLPSYLVRKLITDAPTIEGVEPDEIDHEWLMEREY